MKTLILGGTRFVGKAIVKKLLDQGGDITLFTRGVNPIPSNISHIKGDRNTTDLKKLEGLKFDVVVDSSGRTLEQSKKIIDIIGSPSHRFIYISSAGVYEDTYELPLDETSEVDKNSRHIGKAETEVWLKSANIPFTSFRPTYIYGPGNYNSIEKWFFDRILHSRPIPIPSEGNTITQLGHVSDLAEAVSLSLDNKKSENKIYNCSGKKGITFRGLAIASAIACGKDPNEIEFFSFDPSRLDKKERKIFPLRLNHFLTDTSLIESELSWEPKFSILKGLADSYLNDYIKNKSNDPDFSADIRLIGY